MKCFCAIRNIVLGNGGGKIVHAARTKGWGAAPEHMVSKQNRHNCNLCKHQLACLVDYKCDRRYEQRD